MTVKEIMREWLKSHGYDGLCNPGYCGCDLDDLMACCNDSVTMCEPAYKRRCYRCMDGPDHNDNCPLNEGYDYVMGVNKVNCPPANLEVSE